MRTSYTQYKILVEFMERYGDLSKPPAGSHGRYWCSNKWQELTDKLNSESTGGQSRSEEKWRKVWSDFKNNTKKKRAKINSLQSTKNGTAPKLSLSDMERRVMAVIGAQSAPPVNVPEVGLNQVEIKLETDIKIEELEQDNTQDTEPLELDDTQDIEALQQDDTQDVEALEQDDTQDVEALVLDGNQNTETTQLHSEIKEKLTTVNKDTIQPDVEDWDNLNESGNPTPSASTSYDPPPPKKRRKLESKIDYVARKFLESDQNMREFLRERERERIRQREIELQLQDRWIDTMQQALGIFKMFVEKWMK